MCWVLGCASFSSVLLLAALAALAAVCASQEERHELITALKKKWDAVNQKYQRMCHMVKLDTVGKVKRKEGMENELKQLEADIEKLERPGPVYVVQ